MKEITTVIDSQEYTLTSGDYIALNNKGQLVGIGGSLDDFTEQYQDEEDNICNLELYQPKGIYAILKVEQLINI
tara:strand:- start:565 stop:786 length:222 start_codon:yes stop_codon:yes gene_type:complete